MRPLDKLNTLLKCTLFLFLLQGGIQGQNPPQNNNALLTGLKDVGSQLVDQGIEGINGMGIHIGDFISEKMEGAGRWMENRIKKFGKDLSKKSRIGEKINKGIKRSVRSLTKTVQKNAKNIPLVGSFVGGGKKKSFLQQLMSRVKLIILFPLAWFIVSSIIRVLKFFLVIFLRFIESWFSMPGIADEKSGSWARFRRRWSADQIMAEIDSKLFFDEETRKQIYLAAEQFVKTSSARKPFRLLLAGPPGSGKTQVAKIFLRRGARFYLMTSGSTFLRYTPIQAIAEIRRVFNLGKTSVFFDEADMLIGQRSSSKDPVIKAIRMQLMSYMGDNEMPINIIMTTNDPNNMDGAFRRRFHSIIFVKFPSPPTLARIIRHYFQARLDTRIGTDIASAIVARLRALITTPISGAQIERIVEYIRAITIERERPVTSGAIKEAINGFVDEQKVVRSSYTGNEELPPTPAELFKKHFERLMGLSFDQEAALRFMEELERMIHVPLNEKVIENLVLSIKTRSIDAGKSPDAILIIDTIKEYAQAQNKLLDSFAAYEEKTESCECFQDLLDEELDIELSDADAATCIDHLHRICKEYPSEELLEEFALYIKENLGAADSITSQDIITFVLENAEAYMAKESKEPIDLEAPYAHISSRRRIGGIF